jgi:hypothetical protein
LLKFFQNAARFPLSKQEVPTTVVAYIARQVGVPAQEFSRYDWEGRIVQPELQRFRGKANGRVRHSIRSSQPEEKFMNTAAP